MIKLKLNICRHTNNPQFLELEKFQFVELRKSLFGDLVNPDKFIYYGTETLNSVEK